MSAPPSPPDVLTAVRRASSAQESGRGDVGAEKVAAKQIKFFGKPPLSPTTCPRTFRPDFIVMKNVISLYFPNIEHY